MPITAACVCVGVCMVRTYGEQLACAQEADSQPHYGGFVQVRADAVGKRQLVSQLVENLRLFASPAAGCIPRLLLASLRAAPATTRRRAKTGGRLHLRFVLWHWKNSCFDLSTHKQIVVSYVFKILVLSLYKSVILTDSPLLVRWQLLVDTHTSQIYLCQAAVIPAWMHTLSGLFATLPLYKTAVGNKQCKEPNIINPHVIRQAQTQFVTASLQRFTHKFKHKALFTANTGRSCFPWSLKSHQSHTGCLIKRQYHHRRDVTVTT